MPLAGQDIFYFAILTRSANWAVLVIRNPECMEQ
jgi:hypothetical protein